MVRRLTQKLVIDDQFDWDRVNIKKEEKIDINVRQSLNNSITNYQVINLDRHILKHRKISYVKSEFKEESSCCQNKICQMDYYTS